MRTRIPVGSVPPPPLGQTPFAGLSCEGLPGGPPDAGPPARDRRRGVNIHFRLEKSGRSGKAVVVVFGFGEDWDAAALGDLCRRARKSLGCGGVVRERGLELQGDDTGRVREAVLRIAEEIR